MPKTGMRRLPICLAITIAALAACSESATPTGERASGKAITDVGDAGAPAGRLDGSVVPTHYNIELRIDPSQEEFAGVVSIDVSLKEPSDAIWMHGKDLNVTEVYLTDSRSKRVGAIYEQRLDSGVALVLLDRRVKAGPATLHFTYSAAFNQSVNALFKARRGENAYVASQLEAIAARQVFPGFDEPQFKVPFDISLATPADDIVVTNTPEASSVVLADGFVQHIFETTRPLPTYLLAFAVGPYDLVDYGMIPANAIRHREVPLRGIAAKGLGGRLDYALRHTEGLLTVLEEYFGTPYPYKKLDLIAMPVSFGGAMENAGAITYDEYLLLMDEDPPLSQRRSYTYVHAHEMAHMWFGDLVTPSWWNDIWLNESFASWMENKVADTYWPEGEFDRLTLAGALGAMQNDSLAAARQIREPIDRNEQIDSAFDGITYEKGGGVLAMLERYVGEDRFQAGVRLHMERHSDGTATAEDFIASLAEGTERVEIEPAFKSYIEQPGVPLLSAALDCSDRKRPKLKVSQARYAPLGSSIDTSASRWQIPMCISFVAGSGRQSTCTLLSEKAQSIDLDAELCPTQVLPNADGAGYYRFAMDDAGWQSLIANASSLAPAEALVLADSLDAAFRAGLVAADTYLDGLTALLNHDAWDVADAVTIYFENITDILENSQLPAVEKALRNIARPRYERLASAADSGSILLRRGMLRFLVVVARDPGMRKDLAGKAAARIGLGGEPDPSAADANELETILTVGVQDLGEPFFDRLLEQAVSSQDPVFRDAATGALGRVEDPALVGKLQAKLLAGSFEGSEYRNIVSRQMIRRGSIDLSYAWLKENTDAIIALMPKSLFGGVVPGLGRAFCSADKADDWQSFILSHADKLPGYERTLAQAMESIRLCAALREANAAGLAATFKKYE